MVPLVLIGLLYAGMALELRKASKRLAEHHRRSAPEGLPPAGGSPTAGVRTERAMRRRIRMVVTAALIMGTFLLGWLPGITPVTFP